MVDQHLLAALAALADYFGQVESDPARQADMRDVHALLSRGCEPSQQSPEANMGPPDSAADVAHTAIVAADRAERMLTAMSLSAGERRFVECLAERMVGTAIDSYAQAAQEEPLGGWCITAAAAVALMIVHDPSADVLH